MGGEVLGDHEVGDYELLDLLATVAEQLTATLIDFTVAAFPIEHKNPLGGLLL